MSFNKKMYSLFSFVLIITILCFCIGCLEVNSSTDGKMAEQTENMLAEANRQIGLPNIVNFQQKKLMKSIYELCDKEDLICYAYIKSDYQGKLIFVGKCIGYGIPFSAQYSSPEKIVYKTVDSGVSTMPNPEPNGLFMPTSSSATWLMLIDPKTKKPRPAYFEPEIVVSPFELNVELIN